MIKYTGVNSDRFQQNAQELKRSVQARQTDSQTISPFQKKHERANQPIKTDSAFQNKQILNSIYNKQPTADSPFQKTQALTAATQKLMSKPVEQKWYKGETPTASEIDARIYKIGQTDKKQGEELWTAWQGLRQDKSSPYYQPYVVPTNQAIQEMENLGFDMSKGVTQEWLDEHSYLKNYYRLGTGGTPLAPSKTSTPEENAAYWYHHLLTAEETTTKAELEAKALREEISYWANREDRNLTDDEILAMIDWKKYPTLAKLDADRIKGLPTTLNRAIDYDRDQLDGVIWAARNGSSGNTAIDSVHAVLGDGIGYKENKDITAKRKKESASYSPYSLGSTLDDAACYFGVQDFSPEWVRDHMYMLDSMDETEQKMFLKVYQAEQTTVQAQKELDDLWAQIDEEIGLGMSSDMIMQDVLKGYDTLKRLDKSIDNKGDLVGTTRAIDFSMNELRAEVERRCAAEEAKHTGMQYVEDIKDVFSGYKDLAGYVGTGLKNLGAMALDAVQKNVPAEQTVNQAPEKSKAVSENTKAIIDSKNKIASAASPMIMSRGTSAEKNAFKTASVDFTETVDGIAQASAEATTQGAVEGARNVANQRAYQHYMDVLGAVRPFENALRQANEAEASLNKVYANLKNENLTEEQYQQLTQEKDDLEARYNELKAKSDSLRPAYENAQAQYAQMQADQEAKTKSAELAASVDGEWAKEYEKNSLLNDMAAIQALECTQKIKELNEQSLALMGDQPLLDASYTIGDAVFNSNGENFDEIRTSINNYAVQMGLTEDQLEELADYVDELQWIYDRPGDVSADALDKWDQIDEWIGNNSDVPRIVIDEEKQAELNKINRQIESLEKERDWYAGISGTVDNAERAQKIQAEFNRYLSYTEATGNYDTLEMMNYIYDMGSSSPQQHNAYTRYDQMREEGYAYDQVEKAAVSDVRVIEQDIARVDEALAYIDENGINAGNYAVNLRDQKKYLQYQLEGAKYELMSGRVDFDRVVAEQRQIAKDSRYAGTRYSWNGHENLIVLDPDADADGFWGDISSLMTERERDTFLFLWGANGKGKEEALKYLDYLTDPEYGILHTRESNIQTEKMVQAAKDQPVLMSFVSVAESPLQIVDLLIAGSYALRGENINSYAMQTTRDIATIRGTVREGMSEIGGTFYDAMMSWGDSTWNSFVFGGIGGGSAAQGATVGFVKKAVSAFLHASPMGLEAASATIMNTKAKGGTNGQAMAMGMVTFACETATEAITLENMAEMFSKGSAGEIRSAFGRWLMDNCSEVFGEEVNEILEYVSDDWIMGQTYMSDRQESIKRYMDEYGMTYQQAELAAGEDFAENLLKTALTTMISTGLTDATGYVQGAVSRVTERSDTIQYYESQGMDPFMAKQLYAMNKESQRVNKQNQKAYQNAKVEAYQNEYGMSKSEAKKAVRDERIAAQELMENSRKESTKKETPAETPAETTAEMPVETPAETPVETITETPVETPEEATVETTETTVERTEEDIAKDAEQATKDVALLTASVDAKNSSMAATITAVLGGTYGEVNHLAMAAAQTMVSNLGGNQAANLIRATRLVAQQSGKSIADINNAIEVAVTGMGQASQVFADLVENGVTAENVASLVVAAQEDMQNPQVTSTIEQTVEDNRTGNKVYERAANGELDTTKGPEADLAKANADLDAANETWQAEQQTLVALSGSLQQAIQAYTENPIDQDAEAQKTKALSAFEGQKVVVEQAKQTVENAQQRVEEAQRKADETADKALTTVRESANADVEVENQAMQEAEARRIEEQQLAEQKAAQEKAEEDERSGKAEEVRVDSIIEDLLNTEQLEGEERDNRRAEYKKRAEQIKLGKIDMNGLMNNTEGYLAISAFGRKLGLQFQLSDILGNARGMYDKGVVYLNSNLVKNGKMTIGQALVEASLHEITHSMENAGVYNHYRDTVLKYLYSGNDTLEIKDKDGKVIGTINGIDLAKYNAALKNKKIVYKDNVNQDLTDEGAMKEIVADFARTKLNGRDVVERFLDNGLGGKMRNALHNINQTLKNFRLKGQEKIDAEYLRRAERAFQKGLDQIAKTAIHPEGGQFSVAQIAQATGMQFDEEKRELYKTDSNGNRVVITEVTPDMVEKTPVGMLIDHGLTGDQNKKAKEMMAGLMSMVAKYRESDLIWEIGASTLSSTFSAIKSNSDPQYKTTVDFGTVCAKTQAIIDVMSKVMMRKIDPDTHMLKEGAVRGLSREDIMDVYNEVHKAGLSVPCPVCYVFSRWMGVPSLLGQMSQYQHDYVVTEKDENGKTKYDKNGDAIIDIAATQKKANDYIKEALAKYGDKDGITDALYSLKGKLAKLQDKETNLRKKLYDQGLTAEQKEDIRTQLKSVVSDMVDVENEIGKVSAYNWVTQALCKQKKSGKKTVDVLDENGDHVIDEKFKLTPDDILFDLNRTGEFAGYDKNWQYRNTRGAGMGKAIMPYSGETIGDVLYGDKGKRQSSIKNPWLNMLPAQAQKQLNNAIERARKQNLVGGQRLQSTSDFRPEWGLDYIMTFLELQAAKSNVQMYTKVAEAVDFFASVGADVNLSIMGKGQGWHVDENGNKVLDFSNITGMDYETARELKNKYDNVQMILVGMNDTHIRLAIANSDIDFVIPWHSSGNSKEILSGLISAVGEKLNSSVDYTKTQSDMFKGEKKSYRDENGNKIEYSAPGERTQDEIDRWNARMKILTGKADNVEGKGGLTLRERELVNADQQWLGNLYNRFYVKGVDSNCYGVKLSADQAKQIFPYEYWDTTVKKADADINGKRFADYCDSLGIVPRFSQFKDDPGYWKLLIDRPMYDNKGNYRSQQVIDVTNARIGNLENGKLVNSDLPSNAQAKYAPKDPRNENYAKYTAAEQTAVENASALLEQKYEAKGQYSVYGDTTTADLEQMLYQANEDYQDAVNRGDMEAAQEDVETYSYGKGYTDKAYHGTSRFGFTEFDMVAGQGVIFVSYNDDVAKTYAFGADAKELSTRLPFTEKDLKTDGGFWRSDDGVLKYLDKLGIKYTARTNSYGKTSVRVPSWDSSFNDGAHTYNVRFDKTINDVAFELNSRYLRENPINTAFGVASNEGTEGIYQLYTRPGNQLVLDFDGARWDTIPWDSVVEASGYNASAINAHPEGSLVKTRQVAEWAKNNGYDSVRINGIYDNGGKGNQGKGVESGFGDIGIFFRQDDVKSADTVTYDDKGNVIPLDQRFTEDNDIRYSAGGEMTTADMEQMLSIDDAVDRAFDNMPLDDLWELLGLGERTNEEAKNILNIAVKDIKSEFDPTIYKGRLYIKPDTMDYWLSPSGFASTNPNYAQAYITTMDPTDFLRMTTATEAGQRRILDEATPLDEEALSKNAKRQPIQLLIDEENGKVVGHEGRHRAVALARAGVKEMPVLLFDNSTKYSKTQKANLTLEGQNPAFDDSISNGNTLTFQDVIPLSSGNADEIRQRFVTSDEEQMRAGENGQHIVQYSTGGDLTAADIDQQLINSGAISQEELDAYYGPSQTLPGPALPTDNGSAQRQFGRQTAQESDALHQEVKDYLYTHSNYTPDSNSAQIDRAFDWVQSHANETDTDGYFGAVREVESPNFDYRSADGQARMLTLMGMAALKGDIATEVRLADAYNKQGTDIGRMLQARKLFRMMTPLGRQAILQKMTDDINNEYGRKGSNRRVALSDWTMLAAAEAQTEEDFAKVQQAANKELADQMPANWKDKLRGWRMLSMLGNPRTHIRNILGNALFMPAVGIKNKIAALGEIINPKVKTGARTKTLGLASPEARAFAKQDALTVKDDLTGEAKYKDKNGVQSERKTWGTGKGPISRTLGKALQAVSDFNGNALEFEDWIFLKRHYRNALAGYMTANKLTAADMTGDTLEKARIYAIQEAQKATYRDANKLAETLSRIGREGGAPGFFVNAVLPFKKTPANILKRGIEYSPVGLLNSLVVDGMHMKQYLDFQKGKLSVLPEKAISPAQWIDKISAGLTGTGIMALGALLASLGVVSAGMGDDDDEFDKLSGEQQYAINLNLFGQDVSITADWAAPMSMPFFVGATVYDTVEKMVNGGDVDVGKLAEAMLDISEPVFNLSMLDGVNSLLDTNSYGEGNTLTQIGEKILTNYATSYVPTIVGQAARTIDTTRRKAFVESGSSFQTERYAWEKLENKIPWLSMSNIPYRDVWGNVDESSTLGAGLENFLSPAYINEIKDDFVVDELERLYKETKDSVAVPKMPAKKVGGEKVTAEEYDRITVDRGQAAHEILNGLFKSSEYQIADAETKLKMVELAWKYATQTANNKAFGSKMDKWISEADDPVQAIIDKTVASNQKAQENGYKEAMVESINNNDIEAALTSVEALRRSGLTDQKIKDYLGNQYRDLYKEAFLAGDRETVAEISRNLLAMNVGFTTELFKKWQNDAKNK